MLRKQKSIILTYFCIVPGYLLFKEFCEQTSDEPVPQLKFYEEVNMNHVWIFSFEIWCETFNITCVFPWQIKLYEKQECIEERRRIARDIYDNFIMKELLAHSHVSNRNYDYVYDY